METPKKKRKLWDESSMVSAMEAVSSQSMNVTMLLNIFLFQESLLKGELKMVRNQDLHMSSVTKKNVVW